MNYDDLILGLTRAIELTGVAALIAGGIAAAVVFFRDLAARGFESAYHRFRASLGRAILLGLEILIIADIIGTIAIEPNLRNVGVLALIVLIRTFLSFALEVEISGSLPWRGEGAKSAGVRAGEG